MASRSRKQKAGVILGALAVLASGVAGTVSPAGAAFPGNNGKIACSTNRTGDFEIFTFDSTGKLDTVAGTGYNATTGLIEGIGFTPTNGASAQKIDWADPKTFSNKNPRHMKNLAERYGIPLFAVDSLEALPEREGLRERLLLGDGP